MQKSTNLVSKGKYKLNKEQLDDSMNSDMYSSIENCQTSPHNSSEDDEESIDPDKYQSIETCIITPNEQLIAVISKCSSFEERSSCVYTIVFIDVKSNKLVFKTQLNSKEEYDRLPCQFSENSKYFVSFNQSKGIAINLQNKKQINLNLFVDNIISIDINNNIKFSQNNSTIIIYSLEKKKIIKQQKFLLDDYRLLDIIFNEIYFVQDQEDGTLKIVFKDKILKQIFPKCPEDAEDSYYKVLRNHLYIEHNNIDSEGIINSQLADFRTGKILRSFNNTNKIITNCQEKNNSTYLFYVDEPKLQRFNLITGVNKELLFRRKRKNYDEESEDFDEERIILSDNMYVSLNDDSLKFYNFRK